MKKISIITFAIILNSLFTYSQSFKEDVTAFDKSYSLEQEGNYSKAISLLKQSYIENSYEYNLRLGWLDYLAGQYTESSSYYNKAIEIKPMSIEARFGLIYPLLALGNISLTEKTYHDILKISPLETKANYRLALMYYQQEKFKEADKYLRTIINLFPFDYDTMILMAWNSYQMGKKSDAKVLFQKVMLNRPNDKSALEGLKLVN
jgi:tetratricopeptide (TPR) repeat protein